MKFQLLLCLLLPLLCSCGSDNSGPYNAQFSPGKNGNNSLHVDAPNDHYVFIYSVVPSTRTDEAYMVGGRSIAGNPGPSGLDASYFPSSGKVADIQLETHTKISRTLNPAATAKVPDNEQILKHCGVYVLLTKNKGTFNTIGSIVSKWNLEDGPESKSP